MGVRVGVGAVEPETWKCESRARDTADYSVGNNAACWGASACAVGGGGAAAVVAASAV